MLSGLRLFRKLGPFLLRGKIFCFLHIIYIYICKVLKLNKHKAMDNRRLIKLLEAVDPLIKSQMGLLNYPKYNQSFKEVYSLYEDKVIDVVLKYPEKEYDDVLYICIASIRRHTFSISKSFVRHSYTQIDEGMAMGRIEPDITTLFDKLLENLRLDVPTGLHPILDVLLKTPPEIVGESTSSTRVPNENFLKYLGVPITTHNIKIFQKHRNYINNCIREQISLLEY